MNKKIQSDFLFAQPSYASGAARVFDLWGKFDDYNRSETPNEADAKAIASDWALIGADIAEAIEYYESDCGVA